MANRQNRKTRKIGGPDRRRGDRLKRAWATLLCKVCGIVRFRGHNHTIGGRRATCRYTCWLCKETMAGPGKQALDAHKSVCLRRLVQRYCGICEQSLPMNTPMSRKFHVGQCDEEGERRMWERALAGPHERVWPQARVAPLGDLIAQGVHASYISAEANLSVGTLSHWISRWRRRGFLSTTRRLVCATREPIVRRPTVALAPLTRFYPYVNATPTTEHELVLLVDRHVPKNLPESIRPDVCQQILLDILGGRLDPEQLPKFMPEIIREVKQALHPWHERSLEELRESADGRDYLETHAAEPMAECDDGSLDTRHRSFDCPVCGGLVHAGALRQHEICEIIEREIHRPFLRVVRGHWGTRQNQSWFLTRVEEMENPTFGVKCDLLDMQARSERANNAVENCEICG